MSRQIGSDNAVRALMHVSMLAIVIGIASMLWAAESPVYANYNFVDPTDTVSNRDYTEVILIDSKPGYAQTYVNLKDADRSEDGDIYVRYEKNACRYQTLTLDLQGEMPSDWNYMRVQVVQIVDHEAEFGPYFDLGYQGEDKKLVIPTSMFNYADTVLWIQPFFNRDDDYNYIGDVTLKISVEPTKALGNCEVTLNKEVYGFDEIPVPKVTWFGTELVKGKDYEIAGTTSWDNDTKAVVLKGLGAFAMDEKSDYFEYGIFNIEVPYKISSDIDDDDDPGIVKKKNPMIVKPYDVTAYSRKKTTIKASKAFNVIYAKGTVTYKKIKGDKKITVAKNGKITVKKGLKKGKTYTVNVKVTAAGNAYYKSGSRTVSLKIKVK